MIYQFEQRTNANGLGGTEGELTGELPDKDISLGAHMIDPGLLILPNTATQKPLSLQASLEASEDRLRVIRIVIEDWEQLG